MKTPALKDALAKASRPAEEPAAKPSPDGKARTGKKMVGGFFDPAVSKQLNQIALDRDSSVQALLGEAINDLFEKYGKSRIA